MKKTIGIALLFIFVGFSGALAQNKNETPQEKKAAEQQPQQTQERKITDLEFQAIRKKSDDKTGGKSYRLRKSSKTYKKPDNSLAYFYNETDEYTPSGSFRSVIESGSAGENTTLVETIKIGQKTYNRINNGSWNPNGQSSSSRNTQVIAANSVEHTYKGKVEIDGKTADLYESKRVSKTIKGGRDFVTTTKVKSWFDKDGVLFRVEEEIETNNTITKRVYEYEYGADIKIETPIN